MINIFIQMLLLPLPWNVRRRVLIFFLGFNLDANSKIGWSLVLATEVILGRGARIGHFNMIKGLCRLYMSDEATIGHGNWITGYPAGRSPHFSGQPDRIPALTMGEHSAITGRHIIDCTDEVQIGRFSTFGGFRSQILTHSIDIHAGYQRSSPVHIGEYCFVGTGAILLPGSFLPDCSVLAAGGILSKSHNQTYFLYAGSPAVPVKSLPPSSPYFLRNKGFVI